MRKTGTGMGVLIAAIVFLADPASAEVDTSLAREVDRYLSAEGGGAADASTFRVFFRDGVKLETADKKFTASIGGRLHLDSFWKSGDDTLEPLASPTDGAPRADGVRFRRARLAVQGTMFERVEFSVELEFATASTELRNTYLGLLRVPAVGTVRLGHMKEPFALEEMTSANSITFMERAPSTQAFAPLFNTGLMVFRDHYEGRLAWQAGVFRPTAENGAGLESDDGYSVTFRITGLPVDRKGDRPFFVHVGFAFSYRTSPDGTARFRARPSVATGPRFVDTGSIADSENQTLFGIELALVWGPLSVQGEFMMADVDSASTGDPSLSGFYVQVSYWVTGEHRPYDRKWGRFARLEPKRNFGDGGGSGAVEICVRFSQVDLNDSGITNGGELEDTTIGINWHLNPNARVMLNVVIADLDGRTTASGSMQAVQMRFQVDF